MKATSFRFLVGLVAGGALFTACAGSHSLLSKPAVPLKTSKFAFTFVINASQRSSTAARTMTGAQGVRAPHLALAARSMTITIVGPTDLTLTQNLTVKSSGCTSSPSSTICTLMVGLASCPNLPSNCYTATLTTYDQPGGTGNILSAGEKVAFTVVAGRSSAIDLTLLGVPAKTLVVPADSLSTGSVSAGYDLLGQGAHTFIAESLDAYGNIIAGSDAPFFTVGTPTGALSGVRTAPSTTSASAPNTFTVIPPRTFSSDTASFVVTPTFAKKAHNGCVQANANCKPLTLTVEMRSLIYIVNYATSTITAYTDDGAQEVLTGAFHGMNHPTGITYGTNNGYLYAANSGNSTITAYSLEGAQKPLAGGFPNLNAPLGMTYDPDNGHLYVINGITNTITAYNDEGTQEALTGDFPNLRAPFGIVYDSRNGHLYVTNGTGVVTAYNDEGAQQALPASFPNLSAPIGIAYDPSNSLLYVTSIANDPVKAYDDKGKRKMLIGTFPNLNAPIGIAFDPSNKFLYVIETTGAVRAYNDEGTQQALAGAFPNVSSPFGIAIVP